MPPTRGGVYTKHAPVAVVKNEFTKKFKVTAPLMQAPLLGATSVEMVAAACEAGALGCYPLGYGPHDDASMRALHDTIDDIKMFTSRPFGVNLRIYDPDGDTEALQTHTTLTPALRSGSRLPAIRSLLAPFRKLFGTTETDETDEPPCQDAPKKNDFKRLTLLCVETKVAFVSFTYGIPPDWVISELHSNGIKTIGTASSLEEAVAIEKHGLTAVIASGVEAGGDTPAFLSSQDQAIGVLSLASLVKLHLDIPVLAAGGISSGKMVNAVLQVGASGAVLGTALLLSYESVWEGKPSVKKINEGRAFPKPTVISRVYSGKACRVIETDMTQGLRDSGASIPFWPLQRAIMTDFRIFFTEHPMHDCAPLACGCAYSVAEAKSVRDIIFSIMEELGEARGIPSHIEPPAAADAVE